MDNKMLSEALISMLGAGNVRTGELMKTHTTFRIGGAADYYVTSFLHSHGEIGHGGDSGA